MAIFIDLKNTTFSQRLLDWYDQYGRKDLPWQQQPTPYHVWLSEIMLQQTQVSTVIPYYNRYTAQFKNVAELAAAPLDEILALWSGLGYYARARNLHKAANIMVAEHNADLPASLEKLMQLPGIGRSTAGAIMTLAYHQRYPILDGNVKRVLARFDAIPEWPGLKPIENILWQRAEQLLPKQRIANYIQAQMDLGATLCTRSRPQCTRCPLHSDCKAYHTGEPTSYPVSKPKKSIPSKQTHWIIAQKPNGQILMHQRPLHGIWGGLWSFPEVENMMQIPEFCQNDLQLNYTKSTQLSSIKHVFTHFRLNITPHLLNCNSNLPHRIADTDRLMWVKIDEALKLALPTPVKSLLKSIE